MLPNSGCHFGHCEFFARDVQWEQQLLVARLIHGGPREPIDELRIFDHCPGCVDRRNRRVVNRRELQPFGRCARSKDVAQFGLQNLVAQRVIGILAARVAIEQILTAKADTEVLPERLLTRHQKDMAVGRFVELVTNSIPHATEPRLASDVIVARIPRHDVGGLLVCLPTLDAVPVEVGSGVALSDLHVGTLASGTGTHECRQHGERSECWPGSDADVGLIGSATESVLVEHRIDLSCPRVERHSVRRNVTKRPGRSVAADAAEHDGRIDLPQTSVRKTAFFEKSGAHRLDDHVGFCNELLKNLRRLVGLEVEHERLLSAIDMQMQQRCAVHDRPCHLAYIVTRRRFDLDHLGAEVDQVSGQRGRSEQGQIKHSHASQ